MKLRHLVFIHFSQIKNIAFGIGLSIIILAIRIKFTGDLHWLFLGWNLILVLIPYILALYLVKNPWVLARGWSRIGVTFLWLLFLPNAPYILTDFIHLKNSSPPFILLDFLTISAFAITGFLAGLYSIKIMIMFYRLFYSSKTVRLLTILVSALCGFGIYLGRIVRLNSWDIFTRPWFTCIQIIESIGHPLAWLITLTFGCLLILSLLGSLNHKVETN